MAKVKFKNQKSLRSAENKLRGNISFVKTKNGVVAKKWPTKKSTKTFYKTPKCIVLFGSFAKGEDMIKSDIDIAIETHMNDLRDLITFEAVLKRKISIQLVSDIKTENHNFINSLANGIVLSGYLEVL